MKILFCTQAPLSKTLGASKVVIELAEELEKLGWQVTIKPPTEILPASQTSSALTLDSQYIKNLRDYLVKNADKYDVVDYDHGHLPFPRSDFSSKPLFVARSVLLGHHFHSTKIPIPRGIKAQASALLKSSRQRKEKKANIRNAHKTIQEADLVNVANSYDKIELVKWGIDEDKIVILPYGISQTRRYLFDFLPSKIPEKPRVAFIGTFDNRKGAVEFPKIVQEVSSAIPDVEFGLFGTGRSKEYVYSCFPEKLWRYINVFPRYSDLELADLLKPYSVGIFPSYIEGFGFGVLEMLAASIPVIAYDVPGPPMMLDTEYLVPRGKSTFMAQKVVNLLQDQNKLYRSRVWAKQRSQKFCWRKIAKETDDCYLKFIHRRLKLS